jgi:hypothetical protein
MDFITGRWFGEYRYGNQYSEEQRSKPVKFYIDLFIEDDLIKGTCVDDETHHIFHKPSMIEGSFLNPKIVFYKRYPSSEGLVSGSKLIADQFNASLVQYSGVLKRKFFWSRPHFEGVWEIHGSYLDEQGIAQYYSCDGTWKMKR